MKNFLFAASVLVLATSSHAIAATDVSCPANASQISFFDRDPEGLVELAPNNQDPSNLIYSIPSDVKRLYRVCYQTESGSRRVVVDSRDLGRGPQTCRINLQSAAGITGSCE